MISIGSLLGFGLGLLVVYGATLVLYRLYFHPLSKFPAPPAFAATHMLFSYHNNIKGTLFRQMTDFHRQYGPVVRIAPEHIAVDGAVGWPQVCGYRGKSGEEFGKPPGTHEGDADSIFVAPRESHRRQRRQMGLAFSDQAIMKQEEPIRKHVDMLMAHLSTRAARNEEVNIVDWLNFTLFDIVGDLIYSESFHSLESNGYHPWVKLIFQSIRGLAILGLCNDYPVLSWMVGLLIWVGTSEAALEVRGAADEMTRRRLEHEKKTEAEKPKGMSTDFISYMLKDPRDGSTPMKKSEIFASCPSLVVAGSETTATALSAFCFYIVQNKGPYEILAREIRESFANEDEITLKSTADLEYLQAVLMETVRVFPPVTENPVRLSPGATINGVYVPKDTRVTVYQWSTFRNPDYFVEADSFLPQRWLRQTHPLYEERFASDHREVVKPWSYGARDCIGKNLAQIEMRYIMARLLYRFDFTTAFPQDDWHSSMRSFLFWDKGPLHLKLSPRTVE